MDVIGVLTIVVPTLYMLFGPAQTYLETRALKGARIYPWAVSLGTIALLLFLLVVPRLAASVRGR